jgi:hypothetical protein
LFLASEGCVRKVDFRRSLGVIVFRAHGLPARRRSLVARMVFALSVAARRSKQRRRFAGPRGRRATASRVDAGEIVSNRRRMPGVPQELDHRGAAGSGEAFQACPGTCIARAEHSLKLAVRRERRSAPRREAECRTMSSGDEHEASGRRLNCCARSALRHK